MALTKRNYVDGETIITAQNLNDIQDEVIAHESNKVPTSRTVNSKALSSNITLSAADVGAVPTSRKVNNKALSADITLTAADVSAVPTTRKVNNKALSSDITLAASDVDAVPTSRTINSKALSSNIILSPADIGAVPRTRTVNSKALTDDIVLAAGDIGFGSTDVGAAISTLQTNLEGSVAISAESGLFTTSKYFRTTANIPLGSTGVTLPAYSRGLIISSNGTTGAIIATEYGGKTIVAFFDNSAIATANSLFDNKNLQDVTPTMKNCTVTYTVRQCKYKYLSSSMLYVWTRIRGQITAVDSSPYALIDISTVPGILNFDGNYASVTIRESENCCETLPYNALASKSGDNMYVQFQTDGGTTANTWKVTPSGGMFYANISAIFIKP